MRINLRNGNNQLVVTGSQGFKLGTENFFFTDDLSIRTGSGNDIVVLDSIEFGDRINVRSGNGDDTIIAFLVEADDAEAANTVHREAHGLVADEIYPVSEHS